MNENINLCEILKYCPKGTRFWSPMLGNVGFLRVIEPEIIVDTKDCSWEIHSDGTVTIDCFTSAEPMLFPSKNVRTWENWKCPKTKYDPKTLQPFERVLVRNRKNSLWRCGLFSFVIDETCIYTDEPYCYCIPYNEDTKHLVGTSEEAPEYYRYWE